MKFFSLKALVLALIRLYQKTLSLDHGFLRFLKPYGHCRFYPTCSEYSRQAITEYGLLKGGLLAGRRVCRCHPFSAGGIDELKK